jgi:chemotaxis family two-component system sensor kinase Cph1
VDSGEEKDSFSNKEDDVYRNEELISDLRSHQIELEIQNEELRKSQLNLEDSKRKYWDLYDFAPIGYLTLDGDGVIGEINLSGADLLQKHRKYLIGASFFSFLTQKSRTIFHNHIKNVINTGMDRYCDLELLQVEGNPIDIHITTSLLVKNNIINFRIAIVDISKTKQAEDLKLSLKRLSQVNRTLLALRHSSFAMMHANNESSYLEDVCNIIVDDCGHSMVWIGFAEEEDMKVRPVVYSGFEEEYLKTLDITWDDTELGNGPTGTAVRTGKICICEDMINDPKFTPWREEAIKRGYASSICIPIIDDDKVYGAITIYSMDVNPFSDEEKELLKELSDDIGYGITSIRLRTEKEKSEKAIQKSMFEIQRSNAELKQFAYITSHDLREPLRMITSFLQLLERRYADKLDEDANDFIGFAVDGAKRLDAMINDILIYSKVANRDRDLTLVNFNKIIEQVYINLITSIEETNAEIIYDTLPKLISDEKLMIQLFQNIIGNAIKYRSEKTPKIYISYEEKEKNYIFSVRDNGIGIDQKYINNIFTIFKRLHSDDVYPGTGIGLAIAQKIVYQFGGKIWAESQLGKGTTFYFNLPKKNIQS